MYMSYIAVAAFELHSRSPPITESVCFRVDIVCSAKAYPAPTYALFKEMPDDTLIEFNKKHVTYSEEKNQAVLKLIANFTTLQHRYKCVATNDQGSAEKYFTLLKTERPTRIDEVI